MKPIPAELEAKIDEAKSWMFAGDQMEVARRSRKSEEWVSKVMNKHAFNEDIVVAAIEVMNENKAKFEIKAEMKIAS
jgi:hypothetical protein